MADVLPLFETTELTCSKCKLTKPVSDFHKNSCKERGFSYKCAECRRPGLREAATRRRDRTNPNRMRGKGNYNHIHTTLRHEKYRNTIRTQIEDTGLIKCTGCLEDKPINSYQKDKHTVTGRKHRCKDCSLSIDAKKANAYYHANREKIRAKSKWYRRKAVFGITKEQFFEILASQDGACAICRTKEVKGEFHIDHNHITKEIRGILCQGCNTGLGMMKDSLTVLRNAITYLEERGSYGS